jgi:hypothetical protein
MPTAEQVAASLASAASTARQAYNAAVAANPTGNFGQLYMAEMAAASQAAAAINKALDDDPEVTQAQAALDAAVKSINGQLNTLKTVNQWLTLLNNLVVLATKLASFLK